ncbi:toxin-antitoxin system YwqK family antitoxin [Cyclobacterium xiamenense]|uniref:toxin-antitoxin system YwqK family antitoxin n=1 Tax=Cyclobacterium xiamenense TaxID=1297121 RepID=UPI0035D0EC3F
MKLFFGLAILQVGWVPMPALAQVEVSYYDAENNQVKERYETQDGLPHGRYQRYDPFGNLTQVGQFLDGEKTGLFVELHPQSGDTLKITPYLADQVQGEVVSFYPSGQIAQRAFFQNGLLQGVLESFFPSGEIKGRVDFREGKPHGIQETFYSNGQVQERTTFDQGVPEGLYQKYSEDGQLLLEKTFREGQLEGLAIEFHANEQKAFYVAFLICGDIFS